MGQYDTMPCIHVPTGNERHCFSGYKAICLEISEALGNLHKEKRILAIDFYPGIIKEEIEQGIIQGLQVDCSIYADDAIFYGSDVISDKIDDWLTQDRVFGIMTHFKLEDFIDREQMALVKKRIADAKGLVVLYGVGASLIAEADIHIYADLSRWELQTRYRNGTAVNWKQAKEEQDRLKMFKRGYFFEWRVADRHKKNVLDRVDYLLDTNKANQPKMVTKNCYYKGLAQAVRQPFRVVPYFDPGVWGGHWIEQHFQLDGGGQNIAWGFDCVPEENSLLMEINGEIVETPSINLVFKHPKQLLGEQIYARFGAEFPIRFDFLDTMGGENLSLQVHPTTAYAYENFGIPYTQDESYYLLEAGPEAKVFLGLKEGMDQTAFLSDLKKAEAGNISFPVEDYVNAIPAKKHDHFLIPAGTVHCSGKGTVVLEISATPYIFTFKLWDWDRLGLDGRPRPVHISHGENVIQYDRDTQWVQNQLVNQIEPVAEGPGWREERTGLHSLMFIETRRHWFSSRVHHHTENKVNVLNLIEGSCCIVESPDNSFAPFIVHYAETFIVPAAVGAYTIRPYGESEGKEIATIKAFVRT